MDSNFYEHLLYPLQEDAIEGAHSKAAGIFHADLARVLCSTTADDWQLIRWISPPDTEQFIADLRRLGTALIA